MSGVELFNLNFIVTGFCISRLFPSLARVRRGKAVVKLIFAIINFSRAGAWLFYSYVSHLNFSFVLFIAFEVMHYCFYACRFTRTLNSCRFSSLFFFLFFIIAVVLRSVWRCWFCFVFSSSNLFVVNCQGSSRKTTNFHRIK